MGMLLAVCIVLYLAYWCTRHIAASPAGQLGARGNQMRVVDRLMLGQNKMVAVVRVGERWLLLGVTGENITMLAELTEEQASCWKNCAETDKKPPKFADVIAAALHRDNQNRK